MIHKMVAGSNMHCVFPHNNIFQICFIYTDKMQQIVIILVALATWDPLSS